MHGDGVTVSLFLRPVSRSPLHPGGSYLWGLIFVQSKRKKTTTHSVESKPDSKCKKHRNAEGCVHVPESLRCLPGGPCQHFQIPTAHPMRNRPSSNVRGAQSCSQAGEISTLPGSDMEMEHLQHNTYSPLKAQRCPRPKNIQGADSSHHCSYLLNAYCVLGTVLREQFYTD